MSLDISESFDTAFWERGSCISWFSQKWDILKCREKNVALGHEVDGWVGTVHSSPIWLHK